MKPAIHYAEYYASAWAPSTVHWTSHNEPLVMIDDKRGVRVYFVNGVRHREDGPALERCQGESEWYYEGDHIPNISCLEEFQRVIKLKAFW